MKRFCVCLLVVTLFGFLAPAQAQAQSICQVRIWSDDLLAGPLDASAVFGAVTVSEVSRAIGDYPGQSISTEVVRVDGEPWIVYRDGAKWVYASSGEGMTWVPYIDGGLQVVGYYVKTGVWVGPYPSGSYNLILQNHTEFRVGVISQYGVSIPVRVWLTTRVC